MGRIRIDAYAPVAARDHDAIETFIGGTSTLGERPAHDVLVVVPIPGDASPKSSTRGGTERQLWVRPAYCDDRGAWNEAFPQGFAVWRQRAVELNWPRSRRTVFLVGTTEIALRILHTP